MNHYEFKQSIQTCEHCQWEGLGKEAPILELYAELAEHACPRCGASIAAVMFPTIAESRANWEHLGPEERSYIEAIEARRKEFLRRSLKTPDQLPDIDLPAFVLLWDEQTDVGDTVIRLGERVIWREPRIYEGYKRFEEVAKILRARYGQALQDLDPTLRSELYLYGDRMGAPRTIETVRNELRASASVPLPQIR